MSLDERIRAARRVVPPDSGVDLDASTREAVRSGQRRRRGYLASAAVATAMTVALVGGLLVWSLGGDEEASRITDTPHAGDRVLFVEREEEQLPQCHGSPKARIFVMRPDGSERTVLAEGDSPRWSPDGRSIAYQRTRAEGDDGCDADIWMMDADGKNQRRVTTGADPTWSPEGERIAFSTIPGWEIGIANADGSAARIATRPPDHAFDQWPDWSPDGQKIVFSRTRYDEHGMGLRVELWVLDLATGSQEQLCCDDDLWPVAPVWSPDGSLLAFAHLAYFTPGATSNQPSAIFIAKADGSNVIRLTSGYNDSWPTWSSDGKSIAFARVINRAEQIFVMNADGSGLRHLGSGSEPDFPSQ